MPEAVFDNARRSVALNRLPRQALDHETAQGIEVEDFLELEPVAERSARGHDRVLEREAAERCFEIRHKLFGGGRTRYAAFLLGCSQRLVQDGGPRKGWRRDFKNRRHGRGD